MPLSAKEPVMDKMLKDPIIRKSYEAALKTIIHDFHSGELVRFLKEKEKIPLSHLRSEFVFLDRFPYGLLRLYERLITSGYKNLKKSKSKKYPVFIHAFLLNENGGQYLEIVNALPLPVEITSLQWKDKSGTIIDFQSKNELTLPFLLEPNTQNQNAQPHRFDFDAPPKIDKIVLAIESHIQGSDISKTTIASPYYPTINTPPLPTADISKLLKSHPFLSITEKNVLSVKKGEWVVDQNIIIPVHYGLHIPGGTSLRFSQDAGLISYGAIHCNGSESNPIILSGKAAYESEEDGMWQGIAVFQSKERSSLTHTRILNTTGIQQNKWSLTAGTTFYKSDVTINNCSFLNNKCEDTLNVIHSNFSFHKILIRNSSSDAFDSDFSTGEIKQAYFQDIGLAGGGDGVDTSGSTVSVTDSRFIRVNDKAISIGENSVFHGQGITIEDSGAGIVSKDNSAVHIKDAVIQNCKTASIMAYVKKPEYGPSQLTASNVSITGNAKEVVVQDKSKVILNGKTIETETVNVNNLYETVMKPGLKK